MGNKSNFVSLKRVLPILSCILLTTVFSQGQTSRNSPAPEGTERILKLYPNPATSYITIDFQKNVDKAYSILVYNFLGKKMYENQNLTGKTTIELTDYYRGIYIYHLLDMNGKILESGKFQVSK